MEMTVSIPSKSVTSQINVRVGNVMCVLLGSGKSFEKGLLRCLKLISGNEFRMGKTNCEGD